ncbi:hypothetical protein HHK36_001502 [Tetracentron sinense]|uniref:Alcohol dehydrogenase-like C-terminal domain-containing protein n=1 Tax=Tetracentron sinense TaxID=13715 RepID=A0A835A3S4_TETSI|nr:hypothetical protein HHK36_001502 [Tetracentron sinense]
MSNSEEEEQSQKAFGWAARDPSGILSPFHFTRRMLRARWMASSIVTSHHPLGPLIELLKPNGKLISLGAPDLHKPVELPIMPLLMGRKLIAGSITGGMKETQEMINFAGKHHITADIEVIYSHGLYQHSHGQARER